MGFIAGKEFTSHGVILLSFLFSFLFFFYLLFLKVFYLYPSFGHLFIHYLLQLSLHPNLNFSLIIYNISAICSLANLPTFLHSKSISISLDNFLRRKIPEIH